ncbi:MAG: NHLP-related RiPP peptide [Sphingomonadaceae bacterium]
MSTSEQLRTVLDKLASDDSFRERLLGDPVGALGDLGITLSPDQVPAVRSLPSKESIAADQDALQSKLESNDRMVLFLLSGDGA